MEAIVTRIKSLLEAKELNYSQLADLLGYGSPEKIARLFRVEHAKPSFDIVADIANKFADLNTDWLITGRGDMLVHPNGAAKATAPARQEKIPASRQPQNKKLINQPEGLIPITDIQVAAGEGIYNNDFPAHDASLMLPSHLLKKKSTYLCVKIKGDSMSPTLQDGGFMIIRLLEKNAWKEMNDERIYAVSTKEGKTYLKRVKNRLSQGFLVLMSDNPDKATYGNFNLDVKEINTVWYAEWYLSAKMPNIHDQYYNRLQRLEDRIDDLEKRIR